MNQINQNERSRNSQVSSYFLPIPISELPVHHGLVGFDICEYGDLRRTHEDQRFMRRALYTTVISAFEASEVPWSSCYKEDRGDGLVIVVPAGVPTTLLLDPLVEQVLRLLRRHNERYEDLSRMRLRMALHAGHVSRDDYGIVGQPVNELFRALNAPEFKRRLSASSADFALIVSEYVYEAVVRQGGKIDPEEYDALDIEPKEGRRQTWIRLPGGHWPPVLASVPRQGVEAGAGVRNVSSP